MQAFIAALTKALISALPEILGAIYNKLILPAMNKTSEKIQEYKQKRENKKKAKALKDASSKDDIDDSFSNMP